MHYKKCEYLERLTRLYDLKMKQADKVSNQPKSLMYQVLMAEAGAIDQEMKVQTDLK